MRGFDFIRFWEDFFEWLLANKQEKDYLENVPRNCRECELLGICRDKNNHWKCHCGCMVLNGGRKRYGRK